MNKQLLQRQVQGSRLVDNYGKFETLAALLEQDPRSLKLEALFSTRNSGWNGAAAFHTACDHKGPTLVLIECQDGVSYGGYTSMSWASNHGYQTDTKAFLFRIANFTNCHKKQASQKFARTGAGNEIYSSSGTWTDVWDPGSCKLEVLLVTTGASGWTEELTAPWQEGCSWSMQDSIALQKDVFKFNPTSEGLGVKTINVLLCGGVGAGKSSIVSTVDSICQGRISRRAPHGQGTGSLTRKLRKYKFTDPDTKEPVQWQLWDSMGWGANDYKKGELGFILDGNLPNGCKLDDNISMKTAGFNK
ncbi:TPA: Interferon-induced protein 44-like [Trebouxia sp. C0005]